MMLLDSSLKSGIRECEFWDMTVNEVVRQIEANNYREQEQHRNEAYIAWEQAQLISVGHAIINGSKSTFPDLIDAFPLFFDKEVKEKKEEEKKRKELELNVAKFMGFAMYHNARFEQ